MFRRKNTGGYVLKLSPQGPKMRFKSEKEANEYLAKLKEKNAKYAILKITNRKTATFHYRKWQFFLYYQIIIRSSQAQS